MKIKKILIISASALLFLLLLIFQAEVSSSVYNSLLHTVKAIVPTLFATSVVTMVFEKCAVFGRSSLINSFLFGNLGGYIIGAQTVKNLEIDENIKPYLMAFSFSSGPAFAILASNAVFDTPIIGVVAYISQLIANLLILIALSSKLKCMPKITASPFSSDLVCDCARRSGLSMINVISMSAFFAIFSPIVKNTGLTFLPAFVDVSDLLSYKTNVIVFSALLSFGGLCVNFQVLSIIGSKNFTLFLLSRPLFVIVSSALTYLFCLIFEISVNASSQTISISQSNSMLPLLCMIAMLFLAQKKTCNQKNARLDK